MSVALAAPIVEVAPGSGPAPAWTDGTSIFLRADLSARERRTVLRHEQAHLWLDHFPRGARRRAQGALDERAWQLACELEIARQIYDQRDIDTITMPRSRLAGAILPDSLGVPSEIREIEPIYLWLVEHPPADAPAPACCHAPGESGERGDDGFPGEPGEPGDDGAPGSASRAAMTSRDARDALDRAEGRAGAQAATETAALRQRAPTLASEIDAAGRPALASFPSYRRPSRRAEGNDLLLRGRATVARTPKVEIYVDRSGSFASAKTRAAESAVTTILRRYRGSVRADVVYFGAGALTTTDPLVGRGDTPYDLVLARVRATRPALVVIITDDDPVPPDTGALPAGTRAIVVPIDCARTRLAPAIGAREVQR